MASELHRRPAWPVWCVAFALGLTLYAATANRGAQWQDSGFQQVRILSGELAHPRGLALAHPLQYYLGRLALHLPVAEPALAMTLVSSFSAAVAVANVAALVFVLTRRVPPAALAAAALAVGHTFWQNATYTESYATVAALLSGEWLCLAFFALTGRGRYLLLLAACNGLGIANHLLALLATPVDAFVILWAWRARRIPAGAAMAAVLLWAAGTLPYTVLVAATAVGSGDWAGTIQSAFFGQYAGAVLNTQVNLSKLVQAVGYVAYSFPNLTIPFALLAWRARGEHPPLFMRAAACELVLFAVFVLRYSIVDQYTFFFPLYLLAAVFAGLGLARVLTIWPRRLRIAAVALMAATILATPLIYVATSRILAQRGAFAAQVGNKPYRDAYTAFFLPWGIASECGETLNLAVARLAGDDGLVFVADGMIDFGVRYGQLAGKIGPGVTVRLILDHADEASRRQYRAAMADHFDRGRKVVFVPGDRDHPRTEDIGGRWTRNGDLYVLSGLE